MTSIHEMSRAIGSLESTVKILTDTWAEQDRRAADGRRALYEKIEELTKQVTAVGSRVDALAEEISEIKPAVKNFEAARHRNAGIQWLLRILWTGFVAACGAGAYVLTEWLHIGPPRH